MNCKLIIWSRDRACQLETLLSSVDRQIFNKIDIIYSCSSILHKNSYCDLISYISSAEEGLYDWDYFTKFHEKTNGKDQLLDIIESSEENFICLSTDDTIFHKRIPEDPTKYMNDNCIFSLRLGLNTIVQNHFTGEHQSILAYYKYESPDVISWNPNDYHPMQNYGYPFSIDMHIYHKDFLLNMVELCNFTKPNELESELAGRLRHMAPPMLKSFKESVAVNVPITNMSGVTQSLSIDVDTLAKEYLDGKRLRYEQANIIGCHQNLKYVLI